MGQKGHKKNTLIKSQLFLSTILHWLFLKQLLQQADNPQNYFLMPQHMSVVEHNKRVTQYSLHPTKTVLQVYTKGGGRPQNRS